jgi:uncharacterized protein with PQ loop repeat
MSNGLHHLQQRKHPAAYPHPNPRVRVLDGLVYVVSVAGPLVGIPQAVEVWGNHNVAGISLFYWLAQAAMNAVWLTYGFVHKEKPIIITNTLWAALNVIVAVGVIVYR